MKFRELKESDLENNPRGRAFAKIVALIRQLENAITVEATPEQENEVAKLMARNVKEIFNEYDRSRQKRD